MLAVNTVKRVLVLLCCGAMFTGCGTMSLALPIAIPLVVSGAGGGVAYSITNIAYKTCSFSLKEVEAAAHEALKKMGIEEGERTEGEDVVSISGTTKNRDIYIELERITDSTTRIKVDAKRTFLLKDKATATEIIVQTERFLEDRMQSNNRL